MADIQHSQQQQQQQQAVVRESQMNDSDDKAEMHIVAALATNDDDPGDHQNDSEGSLTTEHNTNTSQVDLQLETVTAKVEDEKEEKSEKAGDDVNDDDDDLEEGELKDDDDDDDDDEDDNAVESDVNTARDSQDSKRLSGFNDNNNNGGFARESSFTSSNDNRHDPHHHHHHHQQQHHHNYPPHHHQPHHSASGQVPPHSLHLHQHSNRRMSPNSQADFQQHGQYPSNHHHFSNNSNNNHYRYPPNDGPPPQTNHHHPPQPGNAGPAAMYPRGGPGGVGPMHKVNIRCRFYSRTSNKCTWGDHCRFEHRDDSPGPEFDGRPPPPPPPSMSGGPSSSRGPPPPPQPPPPPPSMSDGPGSSRGPPPPPMGPADNSWLVYERKHRLAYEVAPWKERGYPPPSNYDRGGDPAGYHLPAGIRGFHRNHYSREPPYGREPPPHHMGGPYPGYQNHPSTYWPGPMGPHSSHYNNKFMSSSQRGAPPDTRRSRSNKRGHDEDESSWSDSGSEDSLLQKANYSNKNHATKASKQQTSPENAGSDEPLDQGSGTPPGELYPEDREIERERQKMLNAMKEVEERLKKKNDQDDPL